MSRVKVWIYTIIASISILCSSTLPSRAAVEPKRYSYIVNKSYPHSPTSYTQGLEFSGGELFESTGLYGHSRLMSVELSSGEPRRVLASLPHTEFGEGITILNDTIYMITWREGMAYMFDRNSGERIDSRRYSGEGWGLTSDGERLYMSDGSSRITIRDRESFRPISSHSVTLNGEPLTHLNELEWIEGEIWANIYTTNYIVIIDPKTWEVVGVVDLTGILPKSEIDDSTDVLNGIAYDREGQRIYVTGKNWSRLFEIEIVEIY